MASLYYRKFRLPFSSCLLFGLSSHAVAWVDLETWRPPKVFALAPSADSIFIQAEGQKEDNANTPSMNKRSFTVMGLYPLEDRLVAGLTFSGDYSVLSSHPSLVGTLSKERTEAIKISESKVELATLYALSETHSIYIAPGISQVHSAHLGNTYSEYYHGLTAYSVWALRDDLGVGLGLSTGKSARKSYFFPLFGGAWQPSPDFRIDGWLPANLNAIFKVADRHAVFSTVELTGAGATIYGMQDGEQFDVQMIGLKLLFGWSFRYPLGIGTGIAKLEPAIGLFRGKFTSKNLQSDSSDSKLTPFRAMFHLRAAVSF